MNQETEPASLIRIAMADDHTMQRDSIVMAINMQADMEVIAHADNGIALLETLDSQNEVPDVALLDLHMPQMDGGETAKQLLKKYSKIKIIAVSQSSNEADTLYMIRSGAIGYLSKTTGLQFLFEGIRKAHVMGHVNSDLFTKALMLRDRAEGKVHLSEKIERFCQLAASDKTYKQIADQMGVKPRTVDGYREEAFEIFDVKSRVSLVIVCIKLGIVRVD